MDASQSSDTKTRISLTVDNAEWTEGSEKGQDGTRSEKSDYIDDLLGDNDSETGVGRLGHIELTSDNRLTAKSRAHITSHASTASLKSFDIHEEGHTHITTSEKVQKKGGCCCIL